MHKYEDGTSNYSLQDTYAGGPHVGSPGAGNLSRTDDEAAEQGASGDDLVSICSCQCCIMGPYTVPRSLSLSLTLSYSVSLFLSHTTTHTHTHTHTPFLSASTPEAWATRAPVHTSNAIPPRQIVSSGERRNDETMGKDMRRTVNILAYKACRPLGAMIPWSSTSFPRFGFTVASQVHTGANAFKIHYEIQPTSTDGADLDCQVVFAAKSCICNEIYCSHPPCVVRGWVSFRFANLHSSCVLILFK
jgi:hypothetical protein